MSCGTCDALRTRLEAPDGESPEGYRVFRLLPEHRALMRQLRTAGNPVSAGPAFDEKRPWGNSSVELDAAEIMEEAGFLLPGWCSDGEDEDHRKYVAWGSWALEGLPTAIDIALSWGSSEPGWYRQARTRGGRWDAGWDPVDPGDFPEPVPPRPPAPLAHLADTPEQAAEALRAAAGDGRGHDTVRVRPEHLLLLRHAYVGTAPYGAYEVPGLDPKRPFGDSSVGRSMLAVLLPGELAAREHQENETPEGALPGRSVDDLLEEAHGDLTRLLAELGPVLQVCLDTARFEPGLYRCPKYASRGYERVAD